MINSNSYVFKPGAHSYNASRRAGVSEPKAYKGVSKLRALFLVIGLACLGYYAYTLADEKIYQVYENWAFDQQIAGHPGVTFRDYVRDQTPFGFLAGGKVQPTSAAAETPSLGMPANGSVIGRVAIGRLNLSAVVRQGVDEATLRTAVGHVPSTAMAGQDGNFAIAAHRDTLFRGLKDIKIGDVVTFQSPAAVFNYQVVATKIVKPTDTGVLRPDGGGLIAAQSDDKPAKLLTMITCYPFYYVGSAPKRFVVEAQLVDSENNPGAAKSN